MTDKELRQQILRIDRNRAQYYEFYTGQKWGARLNYDWCINTTDRPVKEIAAAVAKVLGQEETAG